MIARLRYRYESAGETATLYLSGTLGKEDDAVVHRILSAIHADVRMLRLDLHALGYVDQQVIDTLRPVLQHWRVRRGGAFRVSALVAGVVTAHAEADTGSGRFAPSRQ